MSGWWDERKEDQSLSWSQSGAGEVNSNRLPVKMTTNDGTTKALLQRFIDKESVSRESLLPGGHLL